MCEWLCNAWLISKPTPHRLFQTAGKKQSHTITGRHSDELAARFRRPETFGAADDLVKPLRQLNLLVDK